MQTLDGKYDSDPKPDTPPPAPEPVPPTPAPSKPMRLDRRSILAARVRIVDVEVPEWGGTISLKAMSVATMVATEELRPKMESISFLAHLIRVSACDQNGNLLFDDDQGEADLLGMEFSTLGRLADEVLALNHLGKKNDDQGEAIVKNS